MIEIADAPNRQTACFEEASKVLAAEFMRDYAEAQRREGKNR